MNLLYRKNKRKKFEYLFLAFNGDNKQCLCILPQNLTKIFNNTFYLTSLSNDSCDYYCDNRLSDSNVKNKFKCGSSTDSCIWAAQVDDS